ncbi:MAG: hypothetical protein H6904_08800 [Rhodobacteraceae bacterium]|nr:hypothetical protein [Paracoccaceae bacterium]
MTGIQAVLTGDLVDSTRSDRARIEHTMELLSQGLPAGIRWEGWVNHLRFTRFRGDGWQILVESPEDALRWSIVALAALKADEKALETRIAIGIGTVGYVGDDNLNDASGPAFSASGRALDAMHKYERLFLMGSETSSRATDKDCLVSGAEKAAVILIDERLSRWTPEQAEAIAHFLHPTSPSATEIAQRLAITPQAVSYRLKGAGAKPLREAIEALESDWAEKWVGQ